MIDISVKNLTKFFVIGENLLDGISFEVQEGECVAILGRNGCGKTTLFNILTGQMDYDDGEVFVNPHKRLGLISQIPNFPAGYTVEQVLRSAYLPLMHLKSKMEALEKQMPKKPKEFEDKYYTCPECGNLLMYKWMVYPEKLMPKSNGLPCCLNCLQAIDWSE